MNQQVVKKIFWDYEKEEQWLNEMSAKGWMFSAYSFRKYVFTEGPKNKYTYRIELLEQVPNHPKSVEYIGFLEQSGVEKVAEYSRWVYYRRETAEGPFDIYSDLDSKINHFKRIHILWLTVMMVELIIGSLNIFLGIVNTNNGAGSIAITNLIIGGLLLLLGLFFWVLGGPLRRKIGRLQQEKEIRE